MNWSKIYPIDDNGQAGINNPDDCWEDCMADTNCKMADWEGGTTCYFYPQSTTDESNFISKANRYVFVKL